MHEKVQQFVVERLIEGRSAKLTLEELASTLQKSGEQIELKIAKARGTPANRAIVSHIVGIERWGQNRLLVLAGQPFAGDEHNGYAPSPALPWDALRESFARTRRGTVALVNILKLADVGLAGTVAHNELGELSLRGWLRYLNDHALIEGRKLR